MTYYDHTRHSLGVHQAKRDFEHSVITESRHHCVLRTMDPRLRYHYDTIVMNPPCHKHDMIGLLRPLGVLFSVFVIHSNILVHSVFI